MHTKAKQNKKPSQEDKRERVATQILHSDIKEKNKWSEFVEKQDKFPNLTFFIKFVCNAYIDGDLVDISNQTQSSQPDIYKTYKEQSTHLENLEKQYAEISKEMKELRTIMANEEPEVDLVEQQEYIDRIINTLKIGAADYIELSKSIGLNKNETLKICNIMEIHRKIIRTNENNKYELIYHD